MVLASGGEAGARIRLGSDARPHIVTFLEPQSVVALEVQRLRVPGTDPEVTAAHTVIRTWAVKGLIQLKVENQPALDIGPGSVHVVLDQENGTTASVQELPPWFESQPMKPIDRDASRLLEPVLNEPLPIASLLDKSVNDRRRELVALAARCLSHIDRFGPLVAALNDPNQRPWWALHFERLQMALSSGQETAVTVRQTLESQRGGQAAELYRLLWGFSEVDLRSGADARLVGYLRHESLDFRVLAIENLSRITGKTLYYDPWDSDRQRRASAQRWDKLQRDGQIRYRSPPFAPPEQP